MIRHVQVLQDSNEIRYVAFELSLIDQRSFLQFVTGSPRLPVGGEHIQNIYSY